MWSIDVHCDAVKLRNKHFEIFYSFLSLPTHSIQSAWCLHTKPQLLVRSQASCHQWFSMVSSKYCAYFGEKLKEHFTSEQDKAKIGTT